MFWLDDVRGETKVNRPSGVELRELAREAAQVAQSRALFSPNGKHAE